MISTKNLYVCAVKQVIGFNGMSARGKWIFGNETKYILARKTDIGEYYIDTFTKSKYESAGRAIFCERGWYVTDSRPAITDRKNISKGVATKMLKELNTTFFEVDHGRVLKKQ